MVLSSEEVKPIKEEFQQEYCIFSEPYYPGYVSGCGIPALRSIKELMGVDIELKPGESLDDSCIRVLLKEQLPPELELPPEYKGVRVFYMLVGETRLLTNEVTGEQFYDIVK